jgi:Mor family transcriptional regulator
MPKNLENGKMLTDLYDRLSHYSQPLTAEMVMKIIIQTMGGARVSIPTMKYLDRARRNTSIRNAFHGGNYAELAIRFGLTEGMVRKIVHG